MRSAAAPRVMTAGRFGEWFPAPPRLALGERSLSMERRLAVDEGCEDEVEDVLDEDEDEGGAA